jgi:hypothetical protein
MVIARKANVTTHSPQYQPDRHRADRAAIDFTLPHDRGRFG